MLIGGSFQTKYLSLLDKPNDLLRSRSMPIYERLLRTNTWRLSYRTYKRKYTRFTRTWACDPFIKKLT